MSDCGSRRPPDTTDRYEVRVADWNTEHDRRIIVDIRTRVFVLEQQVPEALEWDGLDGKCVQVIAFAEKRDPVGTGRLQPCGRLARIAVIEDHRGRGAGSAIVAALLREARNSGMRGVALHSQLHARPFYERHGFRVCGPPFVEAGLPHVTMRRLLQQP